MSKDRVQLTLDGQELAIEDLDVLADAAAHADDVALFPFAHTAPFTTTIAKTVLPYAPPPGSPDATPFIGPGAAGTVKVMPFRVIVGSTDTIANLGPVANWQRQRGADFAASSDGTSLGYQIPTASFVSNSSGSPRIDLVYAAVQIDAGASPLVRMVKPPAGGTAAPQTVVETITQIVTIAVVTGTPAATPTVPALPADTVTAGVGTVYVPLALVGIANGFTSGSTSIATSRILQIAPTLPTSAERPVGLVSASPMASVASATIASGSISQWGKTSRGDVPSLMPQTMQGGLCKFFGLSYTTLAHSHADGDVVDDSIDWRGRAFVVVTQAFEDSLSSLIYAPLAFQQGVAVGSGTVPGASADTHNRVSLRTGQSFAQDDTQVLGENRGAAMVAYDGGVVLPSVTKLGLYVTLSDGKLRVRHSFVGDGISAAYVWFWVFATGRFDNA